jgi:molybdopterin molybdotransferase
MMNVQEAIHLLNQVKIPFKSEKVKWENSLNRVLYQDIIADENFPPFHRVMMDGFAFRYQDWKTGKRIFKIDGFLGAGDNPEAISSGECIEIMTGASLPSAFDTVIPIEKVKVENHHLIIPDDCIPKENQHVHAAGSDYSKGEILINKGTQITALHIAVITSCGYTEVEVTVLPKIAIISTGDELVGVSDKPLPYQIRMSNLPALSMLLGSYSLDIALLHWKDDFEWMSSSMKNLQSYDVLIFTGGVSKGKKDFMPQILQHAGFEKLIHGIQQKPGKPIWIGRNEHQMLFGLPGNPVSALTCALVYVLPWIQSNLGMNHPQTFIEVKDNLPFHEKLDLLVPVVYHQDHWRVLKNNGSGDLVGFSAAQGIVLVLKNSQDGTPQNHLPYFGF